MAAHVVIIDFSLQQRKIAVTPSKGMSDVRNEACMRMRDDASNYGLKHNGKPVDLSRTFRQSGLTSGAKLELVAVSKSPSAVNVRLVHPDNSAQTDKVPSNTTLWLILRKFESDTTKNLNITARGVAQIHDGTSGRMYYEAPVLRILNKEFTELEDLQTTLAQVGINSGSVRIDLNYRKTDMPLEAAMSLIGGYFQEVAGDMANSAISTRTPETETVTKELAKAAEVTLPKSSSPQPQPQSQSQQLSQSQREKTPPRPVVSEPSVLGSASRHIEVFAAPTGTVPFAAQVAVNDNDYVPSIADAKRHQLTLEKRSKNRRLLSDAELKAIEDEKRTRKEAVRETTVKIRFPDETSVTFKVTLEDTGASLYAFVRGLIREKSQPYWLVYRGANKPNERLEDSERVNLIKDVGFNGPTLVTFNWQEGASEEAKKNPVLEEEYRKQAKQLKVSEPASAASEGENTSAGRSDPSNLDKPKHILSKEDKLRKLLGKGNLFGKKK